MTAAPALALDPRTEPKPVLVKLGTACIYRPRVPYGRQSELFAFVTRVIDTEKGTVDLIAFPSHSELVHYNNVAPKGGLIQIHCWEPIESADDDRINAIVIVQTAHIARKIAELQAQIDAASIAAAKLTKIESRLIALEKPAGGKDR